MPDTSTRPADQPGCYQVRLTGDLAPRGANPSHGLMLTPTPRAPPYRGFRGRPAAQPDLLHTLRWGHDGNLYMNQAVYIHSHVETPYGVRRLNAGGVWQFRPDTRRLEVFTRYPKLIELRDRPAGALSGGQQRWHAREPADQPGGPAGVVKYEGVFDEGGDDDLLFERDSLGDGILPEVASCNQGTDR